MKKFREVTKRMRKGIISFVLALSIVVQTLIVGMIAAPSAAAAEEPAPGSPSATVNNVYTESGIAYITKKELTYQGDRTYNLSLTATSSLREAHQTSIRTSSEDGYFTASAQGQGYYLLELYGGDGGSGQTTSRGGDGKGGQGGYAYGYIWLDPGDTLVYTIGTIGDSLVFAGEDGSGENNDDAGHGDNGSYAVGAGGGYSAIYLIKGNADGSSNYEKPDNGLISPDDRLNNYIMIAGGGGGGGAGNGALELSTGNANGGAGGTVASGAGIHLTEAENAANGGVAGTYYSGSNGETSGHKYWAGFWYIDDTTYKYVGIGGTNIPGTSNTTGWDLAGLRSTELAQYWYEGGAGSGGNYRGGGGGAGFAGGSGGIMEGALLTKNVGGGGGGSSFIADSVTVFDPNEVDADLSELLLGPGGNDNETGSGGKAIITFVGADPTTKAFTGHLADVTIDGQISQYFDIQSVSVSNGKYGSVKYANGTVDKSGLEGLEGVEANHATLDVTVDGDNNITVTGADITPDDEGYEDTDNFCQIDVRIKAKDDFFGGNRVPILAGLTTADLRNTKDVNFTFTTLETDYEYKYDDPLTGEHVEDTKHFDKMKFYYAGARGANSHLEDDPNYYDYLDWCDYVNVDINLEASGNSYSYSTKTLPDSIPLVDLYNDNYTDYRGSESNYPNSEYLKTMGTYRVFERDADNPYVLGDEVTAPLNLPKVAGRYMYTVGYYVSPLVNKDNAAVVGPVVEDDTLISDVAIIIVLEAGTIIIGDKDGNGDRTTLNVDKLLSFDSESGLYKLSVILNGHNSFEYNARYGYYEYRDSSDTSAQVTEWNNGTHRYTVNVTGWYAIGVRGGQGGDGHGSRYNTSSGNKKHGGYGAFGDTVTGYVYLNAGDELVWDLGDDSLQYNRSHTLHDSSCGTVRSGTNIYGRGGAGGKASWIAVHKGDSTSYTPLIIAAGGTGGNGSYTANLAVGTKADGQEPYIQYSGTSGHSHININSLKGDAGLTQAAAPNGITSYNGNNGKDGNSDGYKANVGQPLSFMNNSGEYKVQKTLEINGVTLPNPSFMDKEDNISGGIFPNKICTPSAGDDTHSDGNVQNIEGEFKAAGVMMSLVYEDKEGVLVGTNWDANNSLTPSTVDASKYWTVTGGRWNANPTTNSAGTGLVANSASTKGFYDDLEFAIEFDKYFELVSFVLDGDTIESDAFDSGAGLDTNTYTVSQAHGDKTSVKFTNINYDGSSYAYITPGNDRFSNTVNFEANLEDLTFDFYLKPADGFVGGNDVPLLLLLGSKLCDANPGTDDHGSEYAGIGIKIPNDPYVPGVTRYVEEKDESDYANVTINYNFDPEHFATAQGLVVTCGDEIESIDELILVDDIAEDGTWYWDYADPVTAHEVYDKSDTKINGSIYKQTAFTFQQQVAPSIETAQKAVVVDSVSPATSDNIVLVSVERPVEEKLTYITSEYLTSFDGFVAVTDDEGNVTGYKAKTEADVSGKLTADKGYVLPDSIKVTVCGIELTNFEYDSSTGMFTIHSSDVIALLDANVDAHAASSEHSIVIEAVATAETFELSFVWWDENGAESSDFDKFIDYIEELAGKPIEDLVPGIDIPSKNSHKFVTGYDFENGVDPEGKADTKGNEWFEAFKAIDHIDLPDHKEFKWIWGTDDEQALKTMPGVNAKIPGYVTDKTYYVNVHYVDQDDETKTDLIESTQVFGRYGSSEIVTAPEIPGWVPVVASKIVTIEEDGSGNIIEDVYFEYIKSEGHIVVYHVKADTGEQIGEADEITIPYESIGSSYSFETAVHKIAHYTPDATVVGENIQISVDISQDDFDNGKAVYIYYKPDQYTVKFDGNSAENDVVFKATDKTEKTVEYNNSFGYDADEGKFTQFPQPERKGYTFLGWFTEPEGGDEIIESVMITDVTVEGVKTYPAPAEAGGEITLYAHWEPAKFYVIFNYTVLDKDNNPIEFGSTYWPAELPDSRVLVPPPYEYTSTYDVDIPNPAGFALEGEITRADGLPVQYNAEGQITGTMYLSDEIYNITYKQLTYKLTVNFVWDQDMDTTDLPDLPASIVKDGDDKLVYNETYSFTRAELEGGELNEALKDYKLYVLDENGEQIPIEDVLSGKMPAEETVITVYYTDAFIESVEIQVHDFEFELSDLEYNTATHMYDGKTLEKINGNDYSIKVDIQSTNDKTVDFTYKSEDAYVGLLNGSFTIDHATVTGDGSVKTVTTDFDLSLSGTVELSADDIKNKEFKSGTVTVTIGEEGVEEP